MDRAGEGSDLLARECVGLVEAKCAGMARADAISVCALITQLDGLHR